MIDGIKIAGVFVAILIAWILTVHLTHKLHCVPSITVHIEQCVDHRVVVRGDGWRAWKIDSTNKPIKC